MTRFGQKRQWKSPMRKFHININCVCSVLFYQNVQDMTYSQQGFYKILQKTSCIECLMEPFQKGKDNSIVILWRRFFSEDIWTGKFMQQCHYSPCCMCVCIFCAGWKLNPVVGAVYGPEFYAGKEEHVLYSKILIYSNQPVYIHPSIFHLCSLLSFFHAFWRDVLVFTLCIGSIQKQITDLHVSIRAFQAAWCHLVEVLRLSAALNFPPFGLLV